MVRHKKAWFLLLGFWGGGSESVWRVEKEGEEWATGIKDVVCTVCQDQSVNHNRAFITLVKQTKTCTHWPLPVGQDSCRRWQFFHHHTA